MIDLSVTRDSDLAAADVYEMLADFGNTSWMKGVTKTEIQGDGVGMVRIIFAGPDAPPVHEKMTERDDLARKVAYEITEGNPLPVQNYAAYAQVSEMDGGCQIEWCGRFEARGVDDTTAKRTVEGMYGVLIDWLLEGVANR